MSKLFGSIVIISIDSALKITQKFKTGNIKNHADRQRKRRARALMQCTRVFRALDAVAAQADQEKCRRKRLLESNHQRKSVYKSIDVKARKFSSFKITSYHFFIKILVLLSCF